MSAEKEAGDAAAAAVDAGCVRAAVKQPDHEALLEFLTRLSSFGLVAGAAPVLPRIDTVA